MRSVCHAIIALVAGVFLQDRVYGAPYAISALACVVVLAEVVGVRK